jgi:hypothetical protein
MSVILACGIVGFGVVAWVVYLVARERGAAVWLRLGSIAVILFLLLGLWAVVRYGVALGHWFRR